jgi:thiol-disulfide isomerase/thioredoxin
LVEIGWERAPVRAPHLAPGTWLNAGPLDLKALRGRVVLVDFWDYTCINCLRTLPYLVEWHRRYREKGLTMIGVHAPEFSFARSADFVRQAIHDYGITYPVVLDNEHRTWYAFANRYWPAKYLIDHKGYLRYKRFGEGHYAETTSLGRCATARHPNCTPAMSGATWATARAIGPSRR